MRPQHLPVLIALLVLSACSEMSKLPSGADTGPNPTLPEPNSTLIPTVKIAPAKGWPAGVTPKAAPGTQVSAFATGLQHPRWVYVLPNGDVLVAEASAPERPEEGKGIKGRVMSQLHEEGRLRGAEREPHHAAARRRRRWRSGSARHLP